MFHPLSSFKVCLVTRARIMWLWLGDVYALLGWSCRNLELIMSYGNQPILTSTSWWEPISHNQFWLPHHCGNQSVTTNSDFHIMVGTNHQQPILTSTSWWEPITNNQFWLPHHGGNQSATSNSDFHIMVGTNQPQPILTSTSWWEPISHKQFWLPNHGGNQSATTNSDFHIMVGTNQPQPILTSTFMKIFEIKSARTRALTF